jgi:hypothetical protein
MENETLGGKNLVNAARPIKGLAAAGLVGGAAVLTGQGFRGIGKAFSGAMKGEKFGKNFSSSYAAARARNKQVEEMRANGVTPGQVRMENFKNRFRGVTEADKVNQVETKAKGVQTYYDNIKNQALACDSNDNSYGYDALGNRITTKSAKTISKELDEMKKTQIDRNSFKDIKDSSGNVLKSAETQYYEAITQQKDAIKKKEAELEQRINDLANNKVYYVDSNGEEKTGTGVASADKVIKESKETMITLAKSVNEIGSDVDDKFEKMYVPSQEQIENDEVDVVPMMKQSKGAVAQTTSGKMSDIKDVAKYTNKPKG